MASSSSSSSSSSFSSSSVFVGSSSNVIITEEEFKHFHSIDRKLFLRLVVSIGHETRQATQFMALFLWFEKTAKDFTLVSKLLQWPDAVLSDLTNEASLVFACIDNDSFTFFTKNNVNSEHHNLPLTQKITNTAITLHFFHQNRVSIKRAIVDLIVNVCDRAFDDIVQYLLLQKKAAKDQMLYYNPMVQRRMYDVNAGFEVAMLHRPHAVVMPPPAPPPQVVAPPLVDEGSSNWGGGLDAFDVTYSKEFLNEELCEILSRVELSGGVGDAERRDVPADERTIFLTFSKGYPISESEIREFFSRLLL